MQVLPGRGGWWRCGQRLRNALVEENVWARTPSFTNGLSFFEETRKSSAFTEWTLAVSQSLHFSESVFCKTGKSHQPSGCEGDEMSQQEWVSERFSSSTFNTSWVLTVTRLALLAPRQAGPIILLISQVRTLRKEGTELPKFTQKQEWDRDLSPEHRCLDSRLCATNHHAMCTEKYTYVYMCLYMCLYIVTLLI